MGKDDKDSNPEDKLSNEEDGAAQPEDTETFTKLQKAKIKERRRSSKEARAKALAAKEGTVFITGSDGKRRRIFGGRRPVKRAENLPSRVPFPGDIDESVSASGSTNGYSSPDQSPPMSHARTASQGTSVEATERREDVVTRSVGEPFPSAIASNPFVPISMSKRWGVKLQILRRKLLDGRAKAIRVVSPSINPVSANVASSDPCVPNFGPRVDQAIADVPVSRACSAMPPNVIVGGPLQLLQAPSGVDLAVFLSGEIDEPSEIIAVEGQPGKTTLTNAHTSKCAADNGISNAACFFSRPDDLRTGVVNSKAGEENEDHGICSYGTSNNYTEAAEMSQNAEELAQPATGVSDVSPSPNRTQSKYMSRAGIEDPDDSVAIDKAMPQSGKELQGAKMRAKVCPGFF